MTPYIVLGYTYYPIGIIVFIIIAVVRLIIRLSQSDGSSKTKPPGNYGANYKPPFPNSNTNTNYNPPGAEGTYQKPNPGAPYGQNPANPYQQNPTQPPPFNQPNYNQPNYTQPDYTQQNYTQPTTYNQPTSNQSNSNPMRSTSIPGGGYQTQIPAQPKSNKTVWIVVGGIVAVVGLIAFFIVSKINKERKALEAMLYWSTPQFKLAFENPSDQQYTLILDNWDTITIPAHTSSSDLEYMVSENQSKYHWKMLDADNKVIADTTLSDTDIDMIWTLSDWGGYSMSDRTIVFNPSRSTFVNWTVWYGDDNADENLVDIVLGDSTYNVDAFTFNDAFIFDTREYAYTNDIASARGFSDQSHEVYLVSERDFHVLYQVIYGHNPEQSHYDKFRNMLIELHSASSDNLSADPNRTDMDVDRVNRLDELIPDPISVNSTVDEFDAVISHVQANSDFFADLAPTEYYEVKSNTADLQADVGTPGDRDRFHYPAMTEITYDVTPNYEETDKKPSRVVEYSNERGTDGKVIY